MDAASGPGVRCDHDVGCITCGDVAVPMRVLDPAAGEGLALCADPDGARETVETSLVGTVEADTMLLVHAGVALQRLEPAERPDFDLRPTTLLRRQGHPSESGATA